MQLIDNASKLHKTWSFLLAGAGFLLDIAAQNLPALQAALPPGTYSAIFAAVMIGRAIKQPKLSN